MQKPVQKVIKATIGHAKFWFVLITKNNNE